MNSSTGEISGGAKQPRTFSFTVQVTDSSSPFQTDTQLLSITVADPHTESTLDHVVEHAAARWVAAGVHPQHLHILSEIDVRIDDLSGSLLGMAYSDQIVMDRYAAGYGWSINTSSAGSADRVDLLSAVTHELGHVLDFDHDVMGATLRVGVRQLAWSRFQTGFDADDGLGSIRSLGMSPRIDGFFSLSREWGLSDPFGTTPFASRWADKTDTTNQRERLFDALASHGSQPLGFTGLRISDADDEEWNLTAKAAGLLFRRSAEAEEFDHLFAEFEESLSDDLLAV